MWNDNKTAVVDCRELCEHQVSIIQQENERLRDQVMALTKSQAEYSGTAATGKSRKKKVKKVKKKKKDAAA